MRFALIGKPLGHSLSPRIHALISELSGIPCDYELMPLEPEQVRPFLRSLGENGIDGANVTIPYKLAALECMHSLSRQARIIGAVNTVERLLSGELVGHNTDYDGFGAMLAAAGIAVKGQRCVILGSGGSARAVAAWLADAGAAEIVLASRDKADAAARFPGLRTVEYDELPGLPGGLLVNCTPVGMHPHGGGCPVEEAVIGQFAAAVDLIYNPRETLLLKRAKHLGLRTADGLVMLAAQAVRAREIWHRQSIGPAVEQEVTRRLDRELRESL